MEIAALILSILSLVISVSCLVWLLAKHFSQTVIQYVPADNFAPLAKPMGSELQEIDDLSDDKNDPFSRI